MVKPTLTSFQTFAPLIIQKYERYLPTAFDESLSLLQKVNKIIKTLDDMGSLTNDLVTQWNAVMEWVMSDGLTESVTEKLNAMVADGTFDTIINQTIFNDLNTRVTASDFKTKTIGSPLQYGGIGDGLSHPLSTKYATLADAQAYFGLDFKGRQIAQALTDELDLCSLRKVLSTTQYNVVIIPYGFNGILSSSLAVSDHKKVIANGATLKVSGFASGGHIIEINGDKTNISIPIPVVDISWDGGTIDGNLVAGLNGFGVEVAEDVTITNVKIINCVRHVSLEGGRGITTHPATRNFTATNCHITNCSTGIDSSSKADALDGFTDNGKQRTRNISFISCLIENCDYSGLNVEQDNNPLIIGLHVQDVNVIGCQFYNCGTNWTSRGIINGQGASGVKIVGSSVFNDNGHPIDSVIRGSFHLSKFDLFVQVNNLNSLINARPLDGVSGVDVGYNAHPIGTLQQCEFNLNFLWNTVNTGIVSTTDNAGTSIDNINNNVIKVKLHSPDTSFTTYAKPLVTGATHFSNYGEFHDTFDLSVSKFAFDKPKGLNPIQSYNLTNTVIGGRNIDGSTITVGGLANVLSTLIDDLSSRGVVERT